MGYNLGAFIIGAGYADREAELLGRIEPGSYVVRGPVSIERATRREFCDAAVGVVGGTTLVVQQFLPYDCSFTPGRLRSLDRRLAALSREAPVLALLIDETTMTFGFAYFVNGRRVRVRQVDPDGNISDAGTPLPAEAGFPDDVLDETERIMAITESMLGTRLSRLIFDDEITLTRYVDESAE
jgi:hypothetical protein